MRRDVPVKSRSKAVQREHVRRYKSGKVARVNEGKSSSKMPKRFIRTQFRSVREPLSFGSVAVFDKKEVVDKRKFVVDAVVVNSPDGFWSLLVKFDKYGTLNIYTKELDELKRIFYEYYLENKEQGVLTVVKDILEFHNDILYDYGDFRTFFEFNNAWTDEDFAFVGVDKNKNTEISMFRDDFDGALVKGDWSGLDFDRSKWVVLNIGDASMGLFLDDVLDDFDFHKTEQEWDDEIVAHENIVRELDYFNIPFIRAVNASIETRYVNNVLIFIPRHKLDAAKRVIGGGVDSIDDLLY